MGDAFSQLKTADTSNGAALRTDKVELLINPQSDDSSQLSQWGRLVMSPFLELDMGHRRFNRNGTALVQI
ncbi:unnamed protein product, partial [Brassica oleracea]